MIAFCKRTLSKAWKISQKRRLFATKDTSLYVHWPFCRKICPYCDFNKYIRNDIDTDLMIECLVREFESLVHMYEVKRISTLYFGGGTPSLASASLVSNLLESKGLLVDNGCEVTMETNPTYTETSKLRDFKLAGVNRVSIGVQALNDEDLKILGREHSVKQALKCYDSARSVFDGHVSIDLMFGRPKQTLSAWIDELNQVSKFDANHTSLYQLTMKKGTPMEKQHRKGELVLPDGDELADMYAASVEKMKSDGLKRYEVSNFAKEGYQSQHNINCWEGNDYIGIGPGAHGRLTSPNGNRHALVQLPVPEHWIQQVNEKGHGIRLCKELSWQHIYEELVITALRSTHGIHVQTLEKTTGCQLEDIIQIESVSRLLQDNFLRVSNGRLACTNRGLSYVDTVAMEICLAVDELTKK